MELKIVFDTASLNKQLTDKLAEETARVMRQQISEHFASKSYWQKSDGVATLAIKHAVDDFILGDKFAALIQRKLAEHMDAAADHAVKKMLESASRKVLFTAVPHK